MEGFGVESILTRSIHQRRFFDRQAAQLVGNSFEERDLLFEVGEDAGGVQALLLGDKLFEHVVERLHLRLLQLNLLLKNISLTLI